MPNKFNLSTVISILALVTALIACAKSSPGTVVEKYFKHLDEGNNVAMYELISADDQKMKSLEEYEKDVAESGEWAEIIKSLSEKVKRKIIGVEIKDNYAEVRLEVEMPDAEKMMGDLFVSAFGSIFDENDNKHEEIIKETLKKYENKTIPMTTILDTVKLVKEQGQWRMFFNLRKGKLVQEAIELEENKEYAKALEKYRAAKETDPKSLEIDNQIIRLDSIVAEIKAKEAYFSSIEVLNVQARYFETWLDGVVPGIKFRIRNNGSRTLASVEVTVYFKDAENQIIYEESYIPFSTSSFNYDNSKPLKPGYIWNLASNEFLKAEQCPKEWKSGNVEVKVTDLEFYIDTE